MDLSVIIVTRNTCAFTCAAVQSIFESRDELAKEVIVVDNGSTDGTGVEMARRFPAVKYLRSETNLGFGRANNLGARQAGGEFLLLLNSDARLKADSLGDAVGWIRRRPDCGIAGVQLLNPDGSRQNSIANFPSLATELLNKSLLRRLFPARFPGKEQRYESPVEVESVVGAFLLLPRQLWASLGGFDERFFFFFEETDLCLRVRRQGLKIFHLPGIEVWHEQGKSAKQWSVEARLEYWRSRYFYFRKNHSPAVRRVLGAGLQLRLGVDLLAAVLMNLVTFGGSPRWRMKLKTSGTLAGWHLRGCPAGPGLPR